jgi:outer membrane biosynthesis protein TonB
MASPKRPEGSIDQLFNWILLGSFLLHLGMFLLVMTVEPPPPPTQEEYATWLKKVAPPKIIEEVPPEPEPEPVIKEKKKKEEPEEEVTGTPTKAAPRAARAQPGAKPGEQARRAEVRQQLSGAGLLASIGAASDEGGLANVFESDAVVGKDLGAALSERGGVRVSGGTRIGKKGALGAGTSADIGEIDAGAGGSAGAVVGRKGVVPQAFVKSTEAVLKKGGIDEKGVRLALKRRERGIQQCYERALKSNDKLKGKVVLEWTINEEGRVVKVNVIQNTVSDASVSDCIVDIIERIRFPAATKGLVPVRKTFVFESG